MVVVVSRNGVHADAGFRQTCGDRRQKPHRIKRNEPLGSSGAKETGKQAQTFRSSRRRRCLQRRLNRQARLRALRELRETLDKAIDYDN
jgi:hypothetical protein